MNASAPTPASVAVPPRAEISGNLKIRLACVAAGLGCLAIGRGATWFRPAQAELFALWAMAGLALASAPVLWDALTSLKADGFEATKYYMDQFVALAILACFVTGQYLTGAIVATILIVGQMLEERTTLGVEEAVRALTRLSRVPARRIRTSGALEEVDAAALRPGDRVRVRPGDTVPADGTILAGQTTLDQASITGESLPVSAGPGAKVFAATTNLNGVITVEVTSTGDDTVLGRVKSIVEEARTARAPVMRLIDRYTQYYLPFVLIVAGLVLFFTHDVQRAIAVIIVAMPCAFVLASPSAMIAALAVATRFGVLVKSPRFFEAARGIDTIVFDKTGTLTSGRLRVVTLAPREGVSPDELLAAAAALERHSTHPVARAVTTAATNRGLTVPEGGDVEEIPGRGMRNATTLVGRRDWLAELRVVDLPPADSSDAHAVLHVARHGRYLGGLHLADTLRPETTAAVEQLRAAGVDSFVMLTGDRRAVAERVAAEAGFTEFRAECLPTDKLAEVEALKRAGRSVLVVGDGVNDAPALAAGDLGVAMGALGSDVAVKTADVALMGDDLRHLAAFLRLSDRTLAIVNQNLICGAVFITLFVVLSALGYVSPIGAACLHEVSAFLVIFNSARLLRFDEHVAIRAAN